MDERVKAAFDDPYALIGGTDAGAHLKMFCGAGANLYVLTHWARDEAAVGIEQAVHCMTQRNAAFFSLHDRGVIADRQARRPRGVRARRDRDPRLRARPRPARRRVALHAARAPASAPRSSPACPPCSTASPPARAPPPSATPSAPPARPLATNRRQQTVVETAALADAGWRPVGGRGYRLADDVALSNRPLPRPRPGGRAVGGRRRCALERRRERRRHGRASLRPAPAFADPDQAAVVSTAADAKIASGWIMPLAALGAAIAISLRFLARRDLQRLRASFAVRQRLVRASRRAPPRVLAMQLF